ncbi:MAG: hypothetical protein CO035_05875, partial [Candidatus Omnitrophica bacterium CG_4_9_14_0_2_um_filter_42_8]
VSGVAVYQKTLAKEAGYNRDSRGTLVNLITGNPQGLMSIPTKDAANVLAYAVELAQKNVDYNPQDSLLETQLAKITNIAARFNYKDVDKFNEYSAMSVSAI